MATKPIPDGFHTVTPYLSVPDGASMLDFVKRALGAVEQQVMRGPGGQVFHADVIVGDSRVMLGQARQPSEAMRAMLYLYVEDADALYRKAVAAGGKSISEPRNEFYGDRVAAVEDCCGNQWFFATHVEDVSEEELARRAQQARAQQG